MNYYNEHDPKAAAWLRELIRCGHIPAGDVDERSIVDVRPKDLAGYTQCHFFAGIGGWSLALALAGWSAARPVWTGSCPCQPFSIAGKGKGTADERHLWPVFHRLISECRPPVVFGEQVASKAGRDWFAGVRTDLEAVGYAVGGADLCAAGAISEVGGWVWLPDPLNDNGGIWSPVTLGAPHIRQRLFWVADVPGGGLGIHGGASRSGGHVDQCRDAGGVEHPNGAGPQPGRQTAEAARHRGAVESDGGSGRVAHSVGQQAESADEGGLHAQSSGGGGLGDANSPRLCQHGGPQPVQSEQPSIELRGNPWDSFDLLPCTDGKARRVESGTFPLVAGLPRGVVPSCDPGTPGYANSTPEARVMRLRGYGNSIVPQVAAEFIKAWEETQNRNGNEE